MESDTGMTREDMQTEIENRRRRIAELEDIPSGPANSEQAFRESEARFRALAQHAFEAIILSEEGECTAQNLAAEKLFGYTTEEALGRHWTEWIAPENRALVQKNRNTDHLSSYEVTALRKDRTTIPCEIQEKIIEDGGRSIRVTAFRAISERRNPDVLRESEAKYRFLTEYASDLIWTVDLNFRTTFVNPSIEKVLGFTPEERMSQSVEDQLTPESLELARQRLLEYLQIEREQGIQDGESLLIDLDYFHKDGSTVCLQTAVTFIRDEKGAPIGLHGISRDITALKRSQQALKESERKHRRIIENTQDVIYQTDMEGRLIFSSPSTKLLIGKKPEECLGKNVSELYAFPEERDRLLKLLLQRGSVTDFEAEIKAKDGSSVWVSTNARLLKDESGCPVGVEGITRNITERKKAEEALRESETKYRSLFEQIDEGVAVFRVENDGEDFIFVDFNRAGEQIDRISREELLGHNVVEIFPQVKEFGLLEAFQRVWRTGKPERVPLAFYEDERIAGWRDHSVYKLPSGEIVSVYRDETDRCRAEQALRISEQKYRVLSENIPCVAYSALPDEYFTNIFVSGRIQKLTDYSVEEFLDDPALHFRIIHPDDRARVREKIEDHRRQKSVLDVEYRIVTRAGTVKWIRNRANPTLDQNGEIASISGFMEDISERKQAEHELVKERNFSTFILDSLPGTFYLFDSQGRIMRWNSFLERVSGYSSEEMPSMHVLDFFPEEEKSRIMQAVNEVFTKGETYVEAEWLTKRGEKIPYFFRARQIQVESQPCLIGVGIDITDRKRIERALRDSEEKFRNIFENIVEGIFQTTSDGRLINANPAFARMFGYPSPAPMIRDEIEIARQLFLDPRDCQVLKGLCGEMDVVTGRLVECRRRDGSHIWVAVNIRAVRDESGKVVYYEGTSEDITAHKKSEEALRESEARYRLLFNDSKDGIYVSARDGKLLDCNQAFLDLIGYTREEVIGGDISHTYMRPEERALFVKAIEAIGFLKDYPLAFRRKDGKEMHCLMTGSLRTADDGAVLGYHGIVRDITEQKNLQKQLFQAQKMEAIGTLAGGIAHDFNNLLQVVLGYSELLLADKSEDDREYSDLQKIFHSAKSGAELVQRLLMFSRKSESKPVPMNLNEQIGQVAKLMRRTIPRMVDICLELSPDLPEVNADPSQVEQVLMNLALNACDAMPDGGELIVRTSHATLNEEYCKLHVEARPGDYVLLEIFDTGHGMDKETIEHIFEPFYTTKEMGRGTGLGLAMVHGIVRQHRGYVTVHSELGRGTTFKVYFPASDGQLESDVQASTVMPAFGTETVLLVEDEEFVRELGTRILTSHGYTVLQAKNGKEALDLFKKEGSRISLVILDLIMPGMGGKECLKGLLEIDPSVKILVASGYSADGSAGETVQMGAKGFITKPLRSTNLLREVRRVLEEC